MVNDAVSTEVVI